MTSITQHFINLMQNPLKQRLFLLTKIPSAFFSGVRIAEIDETHCAVTVPYKWFSQNPFRSIYFACLSMAAEMSTGALAMAHLYGHKPPVSMLVIRAEADYLKKAVGLITFTCNDGELIQEAVKKCSSTGEPQSVRVQATGKNQQGEIVADFFITWSFREKR